jgi:CheY-like chemotaxis protein
MGIGGLRRGRPDSTLTGHAAVKIVRPAMEEKQLSFVVDLPDPAPTLEVGPLRISQAISNLLTNAANRDGADMMALSLQIAGHNVLVANSGRQALELCERHQPGVAILDIAMPDLSGREVAGRIRSKSWGKDMILLAVTGWGQASDIQRALSAGFDRHLTKPVNPDTIEILIRQLVELQPDRE